MSEVRKIIRSGITNGADWQRGLRAYLRTHPFPADLPEAVALALGAVAPKSTQDASAMTRKERIAERTRDLLDEIVDESHVSPASVGEVADEIARYVLELDDSGAARGLASEVVARLSVDATVKARREAIKDCTHGADCEIHPEVSQLHDLDDLPIFDPGALAAAAPKVDGYVRPPEIGTVADLQRYEQD